MTVISPSSPISFRDPDGSLFLQEDIALRQVYPRGQAHLQSFLASNVAKAFLHEKRIVSTRVLDSSQAESAWQNLQSSKSLTEGSILLAHERISFQSFPYEWPAEMLWAAGMLTLDLAEGLSEEGLALKDATPYNVLFRGPAPVFVDVLSVQVADPTNSIWLAHAQFLRTFFLPLLAHQFFGLKLSQLLLNRREGLEPEEVYALCGWTQRFTPPFLTAASIPTWLKSKASSTVNMRQPLAPVEPEKAKYIFQSLLRGLQKKMQRLEPDANHGSAWRDYTESHSYQSEEYRAKIAFVASFLEQKRPQKVLDVGCNTGDFSLLATANGASVVAIDSDPIVVGEAWRRAHKDGQDLLPLVVNLAQPSPGLGWGNQEFPSFLERAQGKFDAVFFLAVLHHLLVTEGIPLRECLRLAASLTKKFVILEFVSPSDTMFQAIARGRDSLFADLTPETFERASAEFFGIQKKQETKAGKRWLYILEKK